MTDADRHPLHDAARVLADAVRPPAVRVRRLERDGMPHNLLAHPLLVLCPPLGRWLHQRTEPVVPTLYARRSIAKRAVLDEGWPRFHLLRWWR